MNKFLDFWRDAGPQYLLFSLYGIILLPILYFIWTRGMHLSYDDMYLHELSPLFCIPLCFEHRWPKLLGSIKSHYWYACLILLIPFAFTLIVQKNHFSLMSLFNSFIAYCFLGMVVDWIDYLVISGLGVVMGFLVFSNMAFPPPYIHEPNFLPGVSFYLYAIYMGVFISFLFSQNEKLQNEKFSSMTTVGETIAHELRTHLVSVKNGIYGVLRFVPILQQSYELARSAGLPVAELKPEQYKNIHLTLKRMDAQINYANTVIDMLLMNVGRSKVDDRSFQKINIIDCVHEALERYPFASEEEATKVHFDRSNSFSFWGSSILMTHVLFNLLKNALYFIGEQNKGEIWIWCEHHADGNELHFKDTALGLPENLSRKIFERFYTTTKSGSGVGLSFCKNAMQGISGDIWVRSRAGEFTEFVLKFPIND